MQFKRLVSGVCAFAIAVTQTAIVPISVSATEYTYKPVPNFTDQFTVGGSVNSTTGKNAWDHDAWDGLPDPVDPSAKSFVIDGSTMAETETPDESTDVQFSFSCDIDDGYYQGGDEFDFTVYGLTVTLTKNVGEEVAESEESLSSGGTLSTDSSIEVNAYANAMNGSKITVAYTVNSESVNVPTLDIVDANDASLSGGVTFDTSANTFEVTLDETTAKTVAENGFKIIGDSVTVTDVSITVPAHNTSDPVTEVLSNAEDHSWTVKRNAGGWFEGNLAFVPEKITIDDFKDFVDNCSIKYEWSDIKCTASRRISFDSINTEIWSGNEDLNNWGNWVTLPIFDLAEKFSRLTIEYTPVEPADTSDGWDPQIKFVNMAGASGWEDIPALHENGNEDGVITMDKDSTKITITLTQTAADALKNGALGFGGENARITKVTSLEAVPVTTVVPDKTSFPNETFREFVLDACDLDKDGELVPAELAVISDINFSKPNEENPDPDQKYTDEKYQKIDDFTGIEYLKNLQWFNIDENEAVGSIDLSKNTKIGFASLNGCSRLAEVKLPETLGGVNLCGTAVTEFDGSKTPSLESLYMSSGVLTKVDVSTNTKLEALGIFGTADDEGTVSDVSKNTALKELTLGNCIVGKLDLRGCKNLTKLSLYGDDIAGINLTGLSLEECNIDGIYHRITLTDGKFDLDSLSNLGFDPAKATIADDQGVTRNKNILTVGGDVEEFGYTYDTGLKDNSIEAVFRINGRSYSSVNVELYSGSKKFPHDWSENILLPAFDKAARGTRLTVEYKVTAPTAEELGDDEDWTPMISFIDNTDGNWTNLTDLCPEQDGENIALDKDSTSITITLTKAAAKALNDGVMFIQGCDITVTSIKSLDVDPDAPADIDIDGTNFPNNTFREFVKTLDTNNDDVLTYIERSKLLSIDFSGEDQTYADEKYRQIDNFKGIEHFTNLRNANISKNTAVTSIDLSGCTSLTDFVASECPKLEKAAFPEGVKEVYIYNSGLKEFDATKYPKLEILKIFGTQVTSIDVSKNPNLKELDINDDKLTSDVDISNCPELVTFSANSCDLKKLDVSKNTKLENLSIAGNDGIELVGLDKLSSLLNLKAIDCGLTKLDVSKNTKLESLNIGYNSIAAIDLTGLDHLTNFNADDQQCDINLINNTFNLTQLSYCGFDIARMTLSEDNEGVTRSGNVLTFDENAESVKYTYDTGIEDKPLYVVLKVHERIESNFTVSYVENDTPVTAAADEWAEVLKVMNNKNIDYAVFLNNDVEVAKLTFPTAAKAKSIAVYSTSAKTIRTTAASVTLPIDTTFGNINIESTAKNFTIIASKNLNLSDFQSDTLKNLKGKSVLTFMEAMDNTIMADISGFATIVVEKSTEVELLGTVKATTLKLNDSANVVVKDNSVTFTNIEIVGKTASICYDTDNFKPVTVTGNITAADIPNMLLIYKRGEDEQNVSFSAGQTVLTAKTASLANVEVYEDSMPEGDLNYTLARVGSDIKLLAEKLKLESFGGNGMNTTVYAQWSDILSTIAANAKAGQNDNVYHVTLLDNYDMNGAFKMPAAKTYGAIKFTSEQTVKTITFTGNITLTGNILFNNIELDAQKKVGKEFKPTDFTIAAGKNTLQLEYVNANIKSITSSDEVELKGVTVGTVTANFVKVWANESGLIGYSAKGAAWDGKTAPTTGVNITGNLTVKTLLELENSSSLSVGGILNAGEIFALDNTVLVVNKQAKGKNALVIGKSGFDNSSEKINFVLVDPATGLTAEITEELILGTIAGPYADQLIPSNDNLTEADSYYIIKSGKNLIAKPKAAAGLVTVEVNGTKAYYKNLNEAIADINASGKKTDNVVIYLTQDMFTATVAKLPLPSAGKYDTLTYKSADENSEDPLEINITGDLALTGDLVLDKSIALNKVDKNGNVIALGVSVGKYSLTVKGSVSAKIVEDEESTKYVSQFANISGAGELFINEAYAEISGKVSGTTLGLTDCDVTLGSKASFAGSIGALDGMLVYDKSIAKNVKFTKVTGQLELVIKDGEKDFELEENTIVAAITGEYTKDAVIVNGSDLKIVRSGNNLKAVKEENVVLVEASVSDGITTERTYDSLASAVNDISRIKDKTLTYVIKVSKNDTFALPKANTYKEVVYTTENVDAENYKILTTTKDITLTGDLRIDGIILNKTDRNGKVLPMSVNLGNYTFSTSMAFISYNGTESQFANINGKGNARITNPMTVSGKINVGEFSINHTVKLGDRSGFTAVNTFGGGSFAELSYPVSIAKNVVFTNIITDNGNINVKIDGVKAGDQIATLKGDYIADAIVINGGQELAAVRSGNKLVAVELSSMNYVEVYEYNSKITRAYDSIANAIADITRLNDAKGEYNIDLNAGDYTIPKLTLPAKGKCAYIKLSGAMSNPVNITVSSDITLTCTLSLDGKIVLKKAATKTNQAPELKFTSPKNKDGTPTYSVYVNSDATIINGTLNGEPITTLAP